MNTKTKPMINVVIENEQPVTTSINVAENFDKDHYRVLRAIDNLKDDFKGVSQKWRDLFWEDSYIHPQNKQEYRRIVMTKDGFNLVAMGFTGQEAIQYKLAYIERFNEMEAQLQKQLPGTYKEALLQLVEQVEENEILEQRLAEYEPKVTYLDTILNSRNTVTITQIAADYGMSPQEMNKLLHKLKVQHKVGGQWILYKKHMKEGYTKSHTVPIRKSDGSEMVVMNTKWTQKGRLFLYELLKTEAILPMIEREEDK